jgi:hypothetical protein
MFRFPDRAQYPAYIRVKDSDGHPFKGHRQAKKAIL